ncbi:hypothetical protein ONE63_011284 [Megalurothrips usitatus]|uniref:C2H2-type domain-containing protein n=1 Tax=Megalurothrips usitatus TaxID=439358 RepID=A0AAV7X081_9NEOP|nr:hypothetical protein ONE63_011284 [Megalurothrips usitatus]
MLLIIGGVELNPGPFPCKVCPVVPQTIASSIRHQLLHSNSRYFEYFCPVESCMYNSTSFGALKYHVSMFHRKTRHQDPDATEQTLCPHFNDGQRCVFSTASLQELVQHLCEKHLKKGEHVACPIQDCGFPKNFTKATTLRVHLSQYHKDWRAEGCPKLPHIGIAAVPELSFEEEDFGAELEEDYTPEPAEHFDESLNSDALNDEQVYDSIAKFYLNLYAVDVLPATLIQGICDDLAFMSEIVQGRLNCMLSTELNKLGVSEHQVRLISHKMKLADPIYVLHHKSAPGPSLTSDYLRKKYFSTNFDYIPPVEVNLNEDDPASDDKYQYISPTETLTRQFEDPSVQEEIDTSFLRQPESSDVISDYTSESLFISEDHPPKEIHFLLIRILSMLC